MKVKWDSQTGLEHKEEVLKVLNQEVDLYIKVVGLLAATRSIEPEEIKAGLQEIFNQYS